MFFFQNTIKITKKGIFYSFEFVECKSFVHIFKIVNSEEWIVNSDGYDETNYWYVTIVCM